MSRFIYTTLAVAVALVSGLTGNASAQSSGWVSGGAVQPVVSAQKPVAPATALADEKGTFLTPDLVKYLPRLGSNFTVLAPADKNYNAFSYLVGVTDRWITIPNGAPENPLSEMDKHLAGAGYRRSENLDFSHRRGVQKVVVYATVKPDGDIDQIQAGAVQMADGTWSCKIGGMAVIGFANLNQLSGPNYGRPVAVYERPIARGNSYTVR